MLFLDMWAYVGDLTSFYYDVFSHDSYVAYPRAARCPEAAVDPWVMCRGRGCGSRGLGGSL